MASGSLWEGSWAPGGPHVAAKAAEKLNLGGPGALLGRSWRLLLPSSGVFGRSLGRLALPAGPPGALQRRPGRLPEAILGVFFTICLGSLGNHRCYVFFG